MSFFSLFSELPLQHCPSGVTGAALWLAGFVTGEQMKKWKISWAQTNPGNLSSHSSIPGSKICIRCSLWSYIGKLCPEIISLSNWTIMKLWTTSWWLLWTKKFWKVLCWFIATTGWMSLQQGKYRSVLKYSILCWKHKAGRNNGILVTCDPNLPYKIVKLFTLAVSS